MELPPRNNDHKRKKVSISEGDHDKIPAAKNHSVGSIYSNNPTAFEFSTQQAKFHKQIIPFQFRAFVSEKLMTTLRKFF